MYQEYKVEIIDKENDCVRFRLMNGDQNLTFKNVFQLWETNSKFIEFYKATLIDFNYQAFYWEHPAIKMEFLENKYECILQRSKPLEHLSINESAFNDHLYSKELAVDFMNLGKDARLVIPTKKTDEEIYNHFGKFLRHAEHQQIIDFFKRVSASIQEELHKQKLIWLNTAGLGVIWLHVRMDTSPKYYKTKEYKEPEYLKGH